MPARTHPQSLIAECRWPSFCTKLSKWMLSQCFSLFLIFRNTDWFIMDTAERAQHFAESVSFVCHSQLAVCCSWLRHLLTAADTIHISKMRKTLCTFMHGAVVASLRGSVRIWWWSAFFILLHILTGPLSHTDPRFIWEIVCNKGSPYGWILSSIRNSGVAR